MSGLSDFYKRQWPHRMRRRWTVNPWALLRPICWLGGHDDKPVMPGDAFSRFHWTCKRCLRERYPERQPPWGTVGR
jgi:hypothetical protein